jgi:hypothetical protein
MTFSKRLLTMAAALTALSSIASGYYHFVYFPSRSGPFTPINLHFNLAQLTNNTVYFYISDQGPSVLVPSDSFTAVIGELQLAAKAWNNIPGSQIQLAYGGLENAATTPQSAPGIDVVFSDDIPVGLLAQTLVTSYSNIAMTNGSGPVYLPILRAQVQLQSNMTITVPQQASFYDSSFTTMVHEFGHALGLQHTLTSATMSTYTTRSTTKSMPIAADDMAGLSLLYPTPGYLATTGSISGQVTVSGSGVNMASVVALSPTTGVAISSLSNPDGTYEIDAIPPGNYLVYVHPLPPAAQGQTQPDGIVLPQDSLQNPFLADTGFVTQFYSQTSPGTRDWSQATPVSVTPANIAGGVNFNVKSSVGPAIYNMELAGQVNNAVEFNPMLVSGGYYMEFLAPGTVVNNNQLAPGLNVSVIGAQAPASVIPNFTQYYTQGYVLMGINASGAPSTTPVALAVTVNDDLYVLPAAFFVTPNSPPSITNLTPTVDSNGNPALKVSGSNLSSATQIVFDGAPASFVSANADGSVTVDVPPGPGSYSSSIEALNPDGQTSGQAIPTGLPLQYQYGPVQNPPVFALGTSSVVPGADLMLQVNGNYTNFTSQTTMEFGSSDLVVKQALVVSPTQLLLNLSVNPEAQPTASDVTFTNALQTVTNPLQFQILAANPNQVGLHAPVANLATGLTGTPAGGTAAISVTGLPLTLASNMPGWVLTIGSQPVAPTLTGSGVITAVVPAGLPPGPATVQLSSPTGVATPPIFMKIDAAPPVIGAVINSAGAVVSSTTQVHPGDTLIVNVSNFGDNITPVAIPNILVTLDGNINVPVLALASNDGAIQIQIPFSVPNNPASSFTVGIGTRISAPISLNIHN